MLKINHLENLDILAEELKKIITKGSMFSNNIKQAEEMEDTITSYIETRTPEQLASLLLTLVALIDMMANSSISNKVTGIATARLIKIIVDENLADQKMSLIKAGLYTLVNPLSDSKNIKSDILYN
jgi:hypothetical protein